MHQNHSLKITFSFPYSTKRKEIRNVDLSNQGTTTNRPAAILQEEESSGTNSVLGAGPGIKGGTTKNVIIILFLDSHYLSY